MSSQTLKSVLDKYQKQQTAAAPKKKGPASLLDQEAPPSPPVSTRPKNPYVSRPEQLRALQLCKKFHDDAHKIQYLNLCKNVHPTIIDQAESFVSDANAENMAALFMWKVKQIKLEWQKAGKDWHNPDKLPNKKRRLKKSDPEPTLFD